MIFYYSIELKRSLHARFRISILATFLLYEIVKTFINFCFRVKKMDSCGQVSTLEKVDFGLFLKLRLSAQSILTIRVILKVKNLEIKLKKCTATIKHYKQIAKF